MWAYVTEAALVPYKGGASASSVSTVQLARDAGRADAYRHSGARPRASWHLQKIALSSIVVARGRGVKT